MKTQVIQLDPHDDVTSVRDRMSWAKTGRILLVYPSRSRILARNLDLRLLQRRAGALGGQLAIVAQREEIVQAAQELGIPVFKKASIAQRETWRTKSPVEKPGRRAPRPDLRQMRREAFPGEAHWRNLLGIRLLFFTLAVLAVLGLLLLFLPAAVIKITPATQMQDLAISASASSKVAAVNLTGNLPGRLTFTVLERSKTASVSGSLTIPDSTAAGMLRFRNLTTAVVGIPSGTVVRTTGSPPVRFATTADAVVPAGVDKTVDVPVQALEAGSSANLPADALITIEGDLGTRLAGTNPGSTTGGSDRSAPVQTAADRTRLHAALQSEILGQCKTSLPKSIGPGDVYFPDTLEVGRVISETFFPAEGQTGETLSLTIDLQCQAQYVSAADVNRLAILALDANLPAGLEPVSNAVTTINSTAPRTDVDGTTRWQIQAQRLLRARIDPLQVIRVVQGRSPKDAARRLAGSVRLADMPKIMVRPAWWPWLPVVPFRITVSFGD